MQKPAITKNDNAIVIISDIYWHIKEVYPLASYCIYVKFIDGLDGTVDLSKRILNNNKGIFAQLKNINLFNQVYIDHGVVTWPNQIDLAPDKMYDEIKKYGQWILD